MAKIVVVTGTPGAGKSTVLNGAIEMLKNKVNVINYGDFMFEVAKQNGNVKNRDELRKLPSNEQITIQMAAANQIVARAGKKITIVDTHSTINTPLGYIPGMPEWVVTELKPMVIVLIEADPKQIAKRRQKDKTRARDKEAFEQIKAQQELNRMFASSYAAMTGASVKIIVNADKKLSKAVGELASLINSLK